MHLGGPPHTSDPQVRRSVLDQQLIGNRGAGLTWSRSQLSRRRVAPGHAYLSQVATQQLATN